LHGKGKHYVPINGENAYEELSAKIGHLHFCPKNKEGEHWYLVEVA